MNHNIICFVGSNSSKSINVQLVKSLLKHNMQNQTVEYIDIREWQLPIFSQDIETNEGYPKHIKELAEKIKNATHVLVGTNEHNAALSAFFKNILDWLSRYDKLVLEDKKYFVVSTSEGARGALSANEYAQSFFHKFKAKEVLSFAFPNFSKNFSIENQVVVSDELNNKFNDIVKEFIK